MTAKVESLEGSRCGDESAPEERNDERSRAPEHATSALGNREQAARVVRASGSVCADDVPAELKLRRGL